MKINIEEPKILQISMRAEPGDSIYGECQWMIVNFDLKNWSMSASGDNGNFQYSWAVEDGDRSFLELMCQLEKEYLLEKISDRTIFSVNDTIETIKYNYNLSKKQLMFFDNLERKYSLDRNNFNIALSDSGLFNKQFISDLWECMEYDYPQRAKTFTEIFTTIIRDKIKEYLENK